MTPALETLSDRAVSILKDYGVVRAGAFGSYARGEQRPDSDLDLVVEFESGRSLIDLVQLQEALCSALGLDVEVATYRSLHPMLSERILAEEQRIL
jgi:predicted nucleotidyltransferase